MTGGGRRLPPQLFQSPKPATFSQKHVASLRPPGFPRQADRLDPTLSTLFHTWKYTVMSPMLLVHSGQV